MSGATQSQRGRSGKKWVGLNYKEKERAKEANGGTMPYTLSLVTSDFPHQAEWSLDNLPDILHYIHPPRSQYVGARVVDLIENGQPVASGAPDGHNIRDYEILPRHISLDVQGWLIETWRRLDPRIGYQDILDRQYADPELGLKKHTKNALQNHCRRECRKILNTWVEYGRRPEPHRTEVEAIERLSYDNILFNTTLNRSVIMPHRLVKVRLERRVTDGLYYKVPYDVTEENWRETTLPLDHFLPNRRLCEMTKEMNAAFDMYIRLMERAQAHDLNHWSKLDRGCLPVTWYDRTRTKSVPNDTYDGGCAICTWSPDRKVPVSPRIKVEAEATPKMRGVKRRRGHTKIPRTDDKPKPSKRRYTTRLSSHRPETPAEESDSASSSGDVGYTYVETYRRTEDEYEYYNVDTQSGSLYDEGAEHEGSQHDGNERDQDGQGDETVPFGNAKSVSTSPVNEQEATGMVRQFGTDDPFSTPSGKQISQPKGSRKTKTVANSSSGRSLHSRQTESWLRRSDFLRSDSFSQDTEHGSSPSVEGATVPVSKPAELPGYLPASAFSRGHSSYTLATAPSGTSFLPINASFATAASSYVEASRPAMSDYNQLPTPLDGHFPENHFYPARMMQSQAGFRNPAYVSPPETVIQQNRLSFNSSPPRQPEPACDWNQDRQRRHSETDATLGSGMGLPSDLAELGAFAYGSSYLANGEFGNGLELQPTVQDNQFAYANPFESNEPEIGEVVTVADGEYMGMVVDPSLDAYNDHELFGKETNGTTAPFPTVEV